MPDTHDTPQGAEPQACRGPETPAEIAALLRAKVKDIQENGPMRPLCMGHVLALRIADALESRAAVAAETERKAALLRQRVEEMEGALRDISIAPCLFAILGEECGNACPGCRARAALPTQEGGSDG